MKFEYFTPGTGSCNAPKGYVPFLSCFQIFPEVSCTTTLIPTHMQQSQEPRADWIPLPVSNNHMLYTSIIMPAQKSTTKRKKKEEAVKRRERIKFICFLSISL